MIPKPIKKLLLEIVEKVGNEEDKRVAEAHPEKCLTDLLLNINKDIADASSMLKMTVRDGITEYIVSGDDRFLGRSHKSRKANGRRKSKKVLAIAR